MDSLWGVLLPEITAFTLAQRFVGVKEVAGTASNPLILAMLRLDDQWPEGDEVPWCSAFLNFICWLGRWPRSKSLAARSWLQVGQLTELKDATPAYDVVVLSRDGGGGHVGLFAGFEEKGFGGSVVYLLGGNQGDAVNVSGFAVKRIVGVRRLLPSPRVGTPA